jgi:hypothetical protein
MVKIILRGPLPKPRKRDFDDWNDNEENEDEEADEESEEFEADSCDDLFGEEMDDGRCFLLYPAKWLCRVSPVVANMLTSVYRYIKGILNKCAKARPFMSNIYAYGVFDFCPMSESNPCWKLKS